MQSLINRMGGLTCCFSGRRALSRNIFGFSTGYLGKRYGPVTIEVRLNAPVILAFSETLNNTIAIASSDVLLTRGDKSLAVCPGSVSHC